MSNSTTSNSTTSNSTTSNSAGNQGRRIARAASIVLAIGLAATACSSSGENDLVSQAQERQPVTTAAAAAPAPTSTSVEPSSVTTEAPVVAATPIRAISTVAELEVVTEPGSIDVVALLSDRTEFGSARVLLVEAVEGDWVRVQVPVRPNGTSGWVRASDVTLEAIDARVEVDLATRTITTWIDGEVLVHTSVAIGSPENPTPTGLFFITDKVDTGNDDGAYGPFALGLSAHSDTLTEFAGGEGQIGLHGTNAPDSIGRAVSHGCVRLPNELIEILATQLPLGTPVIVR